MRHIQLVAIVIAITANVSVIRANFCVETDPPTECSWTIGPQLNGELAGWINLGGEVVVETIGVEEPLAIFGLDLQSSGSHLRPKETLTPAPFLFNLSNTNSRITFGSLGPGEPMELSWPSGISYDLEAALGSSGPCVDLILAGGPMVTRRTSFCTLAGDTNFDGSVTFSDFLTLSANFGMQNAVWPDGDFDFNREIGFSDFLSLSENFGQTLSELTTNNENRQAAVNVPEPSGFIVFSMACAAFAFVGRRRK